GDRLLVLPSRRAQVDVRIDEARSEHEPSTVDHTVAVGVEALAERRDRAAVDADIEDGVDAFRRVEDAGAADDEVVAPSAAHEHGGAHATPAVAASTATGPLVTRP